MSKSAKILIAFVPISVISARKFFTVMIVQIIFIRTHCGRALTKEDVFLSIKDTSRGDKIIKGTSTGMTTLRGEHLLITCFSSHADEI